MRMNLKIWMAVKIIPALLLFAYYHALATGFMLDSKIAVSLSLLILVALRMVKKYCVESSDERSREIIQRVDAFCYRLSIAAMGIIILPFLFLDPVGANLVGYLIVGSIALLTIGRAIAFLVLDKRGM